MKHYVYKLENPDTGRYYFGSRSCRCKVENDDYMGSMKRWKPDKSKLIKTILRDDFSTREEALEYEAEIIAEHIDDKLNENYYIPDRGFHTVGLNVCSKEAFIERYGETVGLEKYEKWYNGIKLSLTARLKNMSAEERKEKFGQAGKINPNYGKRWSKKWKKEQSERMIEYYETHKPPRLGETHTEEAKNKMSKHASKRFSNRKNHPKYGTGETVLQCSKDGTVIKEWISATEAARYFDVHRTNIYRCLQGKNKSSCGFIWKYKK